MVVFKFGTFTGTISKHIPHWRRTETAGGRGRYQITGENWVLVPNLCLHWGKGYLHRDSSYMTGNPPPFISPLYKSSALSSAHTEGWYRCLNTCPCDRDLLVSHLGSVVGGNVALTACGCGSNNQKITVAVGENKQSWLIVSRWKQGGRWNINHILW